MTDDKQPVIDIGNPESELPRRWHVEAAGHPSKPALQGSFDELPDFAGYRFVFYRERKE